MSEERIYTHKNCFFSKFTVLQICKVYPATKIKCAHCAVRSVLQQHLKPQFLNSDVFNHVHDTITTLHKFLVFEKP